jgi:N6-adenosine-specific RNA methylase IME4
VKPEDAEEYTQALGQVVAGGWRQIALGQRLGVPKALGLSVDAWVTQRLGGYVRLSIEERQSAAVELKGKGHSQRQIAAVLGVDEITIRRDRNATNVAPTDNNPEQINDSATNVAAQRRAKREAIAAAARLAADLPTARFRVVYADPPWSYHDKADAGAVQSGGAEQHYPSMSIAELCALPVASICESNAVLFLWTTSPLLAESFEVIKAWGFTYKSSFVWDKHAHNMGHYNSVRHEFLLVCVRGSCPPDVPKLFDSVQKTGRTEHSEKPGVFRIIIDTLYPHGKRVELFARETVKGWTSWGNEVEATG